MKKIFTIAAAAAMIFGAASCQKEILDGKKGDATVTFNVQIPEEVVTRAEMSDGSTVDQLVYEVYVGNDVMYEGTVPPTATGSGQFSLELNLVTGMTYDLLFWAQNSSVGCYNTDNLKNVSVNYTGTANDEKRDAFYGARLGFEATGIATSETINLYRPFAQINFGSAPTDWEKAQPFIAKGGLKSQVYMTGVPTRFNVYEGDVVKNSNTDVTFTYDLCPASETAYSNDFLTYKDANDLSKVYQYGWVAMNYVLAPKSESAMNEVKASFVHDKNDENSALVKQVFNVPFKQNYRTNILGEIFTGGNKFTVVIVPGFANDPIENFPDYTIAEPVLFALENGGTVTLNEDTVLPRNITTDKDVVINLNGQKLSYASADINVPSTFVMVRVENGGSLTINGEGEIVSNGYVASANVGGKIVVNGGSFTANTTTFQANGGEVYITGGTFKLADATDTRYVLNHIDSKKDAGLGLISVSGGTFHGFNPGDSNSENPPMSFLAYGYESVETSTGSGVWKVKAAAAVPITLTSDVKTVATIKATVLNGAAKKIEADFSATTSEYIVLAQQGGLIENVKIYGSNKRNAIDKVQRGIYISNVNADVTINNVEIYDVAYTINTGGNIAADKTLTVTDSKLEGWTSPASFGNVEFTGCEFTIGDYYGTAAGADPSWNGCFRAATETLLKNCTFQKGFYISLYTMIEGGTLTLENCTVDGVVLTAANIANYLNESEAGTLKKVIVK